MIWPLFGHDDCGESVCMEQYFPLRPVRDIIRRITLTYGKESIYGYQRHAR